MKDVRVRIFLQKGEVEVPQILMRIELGGYS